MLYTQTGDLESARKFYEQSIEVSSEIDDKQGLALSEFNLAGLLSTMGQYLESRKRFESAGRTYYILKDSLSGAEADAGIAQILYLQGDVRKCGGETP